MLHYSFLPILLPDIKLIIKISLSKHVSNCTNIMDKKSTFYSLWFLICVVCNEKLHTLFDYTGQNIWINPLISSFVENFYITTHDALHMFLLLQIFNLQKIRFRVNDFLLQKNTTCF